MCVTDQLLIHAFMQNRVDGYRKCPPIWYKGQMGNNLAQGKWFKLESSCGDAGADAGIDARSRKAYQAIQGLSADNQNHGCMKGIKSPNWLIELLEKVG
jgi:hypothetical protein